MPKTKITPQLPIFLTQLPHNHITEDNHIKCTFLTIEIVQKPYLFRMENCILCVCMCVLKGI